MHLGRAIPAPYGYLIYGTEMARREDDVHLPSGAHIPFEFHAALIDRMKILELDAVYGGSEGVTNSLIA